MIHDVDWESQYKTENIAFLKTLKKTKDSFICGSTIYQKSDISHNLFGSEAPARQGLMVSHQVKGGCLFYILEFVIRHKTVIIFIKLS